MLVNAQLGLHGSGPFDQLAGQYYNSGLISVYFNKLDVFPECRGLILPTVADRCPWLTLPPA